MTGQTSIFEKTYRDYLARISGMNFRLAAERLGGRAEGDRIQIPLYGEWHTISETGITDAQGNQPSLDVCVILCQYLLLCPSAEPQGGDWVSYKDLKDSGPLIVYFRHDVEEAVAGYFGGRLDALSSACRVLGGYPPHMNLSHDLTMQFDTLPRVPVLLIFNDADDEFPAVTSLLFERRAESYLDPESLAMAGRLLFVRLKRAAAFEMNS